MRVLVVTNPFGGFEKGQHIKDPAKIAEVLAGECAHSVVPIDVPDEPAASQE